MINTLGQIFSRSKNKIEKTILNKTEIYNSLDDIPLYNWVKIYDTNDLRYIIKNSNEENIDSLSYKSESLLKGWDMIYDEYLNDFGLTKKYKKILQLEKKIAILLCDRFIKKDLFIENEINILKKQLEDIQTGKQKVNENFTKQIVIIEKWLSATLDKHLISARKFFTYIELMELEQDQLKKQQLNKENG